MVAGKPYFLIFDLYNNLLPSKEHYTEQELVSLLQQGDESAFSYLYDHYSGAMYGMLVRILPDRDLAEDVLQEVFIKIYHNIGNYDSSRGKLYTWLISVTRNTAIDALRSKDFKKSKRIQELNIDVHNSEDATANSFVNTIGLDKVLNELKEDQLQIIDLAYYKGFTQQEISGKLHIPLGTVKSRVRGALIQLRKILNVLL